MDLAAIQNFKIPSTDHQYGWKDMALYALSLGYGADPLDEGQLAFVYEGRGPVIVPSVCNTLAHPGFWLNRPDLKIDWMKVLHAEQSFRQHRPLPPKGKVTGKYEIKSVEDKGADKGAILTLEKQLIDCLTGELLFTVGSAIFLRGDGGQGGFGERQVQAEPPPAGLPDLVEDIATLPQTALLYRLNGDVNPLHADPEVARKAGFRQPILHGLGTMGIATRALLNSACDNDPSRLKSMRVRFSQPVYPGETLRTELFTGGTAVRFRCRAVERDVVVLDRGIAEIA